MSYTPKQNMNVTDYTDFTPPAIVAFSRKITTLIEEGRAWDARIARAKAKYGPEFASLCYERQKWINALYPHRKKVLKSVVRRQRRPPSPNRYTSLAALEVTYKEVQRRRDADIHKPRPIYYSLREATQWVLDKLRKWIKIVNEWEQRPFPVHSTDAPVLDPNDVAEVEACIPRAELDMFVAYVEERVVESIQYLIWFKKFKETLGQKEPPRTIPPTAEELKTYRQMTYSKLLQDAHPLRRKKQEDYARQRHEDAIRYAEEERRQKNEWARERHRVVQQFASLGLYFQEGPPPPLMRQW